MLIQQDIMLRRLTLQDKSSMALLANNKKIFDNVRDYLPFPYTEKDAEVFIDSVKDASPVTIFAIDYKEEFCGVIGLIRQADVYRLTAEIGYWIGEPYWNKGITTMAAQLITRYGFNELKLIRIHTGIFEYNKKARCAYWKNAATTKIASLKNQL